MFLEEITLARKIHEEREKGGQQLRERERERERESA